MTDQKRKFNSVKMLMTVSIVFGILFGVLFLGGINSSASTENKGSISISLTEGIAINYYIELTSVSEDPVAYFDFTEDTLDASVIGISQGNKWCFTYENIAPQYLDTVFSVSIGEEVYASDLSVAMYCSKLCSSTVGELGISLNEYYKTVTAAKDILYYGAAAKAYANNSDAALTEMPGTPYANSYVSEAKPTQSSDPDYRITSATCYLESKPALRFKFKLPSTDEIVIKIDNKQMDFRRESSDSDNYVVTYDAVSASELLDHRVTVELIKNGEVIQTLEYGFNDYISRIQNNENKNMVTLAQALWSYGMSAQALSDLPEYTPNGDKTHSVNGTDEDCEFIDYNYTVSDYFSNGADGSLIKMDNALVEAFKSAGTGDAYWPRGLTSDGRYIYGVLGGYASGTQLAVMRYDPVNGTTAYSKVLTLTSTTKVDDKSGGITYYDGKLYVYPDTRSATALGTYAISIDADFTADTNFNTKDTFFHDKLGAGIVEIVYNEKHETFLVRFFNKDTSQASVVYMYDRDFNKLDTVITTPHKLNNMRISCDDDYIYSSVVGIAAMSIIAYDWESGTQVIMSDTEYDRARVYGSDVGLPSSNANVSAHVVHNGEWYFAGASYSSGTTYNKYVLGKVFSYKPLDNCYYCDYNETESEDEEVVEPVIPVGEYELSVMSFNTLCELWNTKPTIESRVYGNTGLILANMPDIVGLQEVSEHTYEVWNSEFINVSDYAWVNTKTDLGNTNYSPIIYNTKTIKILENGCITYTDYGGMPKLRVFTWAYCEIIASGERFVAANTHWSVNDTNPTSVTAQSSEMAELSLQMVEKYSAPIISTGDFNVARNNSNFVNYLTLSGFKSANDTAENHGVVTRTYHTWLPDQEFDYAVASDYDQAPGWTIDFITHSDDVDSVYYTVVVNETAWYSSDHYPVFATFNLNGK